MGLEALLREKPYQESLYKRIEYGQKVINELLPLVEGIASAYPAFQQVLKNPQKAGIAGMLLANNIEKVCEVTKLSPTIVQEAIMNGDGVIGYMKRRLLEGAGLIAETTSADVGSWDAIYMGVTAFIFPSTVSSNFVSIQPLNAPTGVIFYRDYTVNGRTIDASALKDQPGSAYRSDTIGTGNGTTTDFTGTLSSPPVIPGTVEVTAGTVLLTDNGDGTLSGAGGSGTINYETGDIAVSFTTAPANGTAVVVDYKTATLEGALGARVNITLRKENIVTESRKLSYEWTTEAAQDLMAYHGIAIEDEIAAAFANAVAGEIDAEIISRIRKAAIRQGVVDVTWSQTPLSGVSYTDHKVTLYSEMRKVYARIIDALGGLPEGATPFAVMGANAWGIVQDIASFTNSPDMFMGNALGGKLGEIDVYYSPFMPADEIIVGLKHSDLTFTGFVYAPYRLEISPAVNTVVNIGGTVDIDPHRFKKGVLSRDAFKVVRPQMYARITITP